MSEPRIDNVITLDRIIIPLQLTAAEVNVILKYLSTGVFSEVAPIIARVKEQGDPCVNAAMSRTSVPTSLTQETS